LRFINEILDLSKIEAGKLELNPEPVNLARFIDEVIGTAGGLAEKNQNRLVVEAQENLATLKAGDDDYQERKMSQTVAHILVGGLELHRSSAASLLLPVRVQAELLRFRHLGPFWFPQPSRACPSPAATLAEFGGSRGGARRSCQPRHPAS
jgi:signal transduction histidine kinase